MQGLQLCADLHGCRGPLLTELPALRALLIEAVQGAGLSVVAERFHAFEPAGSGVTGVVLLAESHLAVHTWPEQGAVTLDLYVCNHSADNSAKAEALWQTVHAAFAPQQVDLQRLQRGSVTMRSNI
ncbi:MAG: adenosylmethionine decarboxylase [Burkholderiales bacterium]|nr:adenosylmethionine decarboxylase [Burkholderiales bacterium]